MYMTIERPEYQVRALAFIKKIIKEGRAKNQTDLGVQLSVSKQQVNAFYKRGYVSKPIIDTLCEKFEDAKEFIYKDELKEEQVRPDSFNDRIQGIEVTNQRPLRVVHERAHAGFAAGWSDKEWIDNLPVEMLYNVNVDIFSFTYLYGSPL